MDSPTASRIPGLGYLPETRNAVMFGASVEARAMAASGDLTALSFLRTKASNSPMAAEALVDLLQEAGHFHGVLDQAERGFQRFGEAVLTHKCPRY